MMLWWKSIRSALLVSLAMGSVGAGPKGGLGSRLDGGVGVPESDDDDDDDDDDDVAGTGNHKLALLMAQSYLGRRQARRALAAYQAILEVRPNHMRAHVGVIRAMADLELCTDVEAHYVVLEGTSQDNSTVQLAMGACAEVTSAMDEALEHYRMAASLDPDDPAGPVALARLQLALGDASGFEDTLAALPGRERGPAYGALLEAERAELERDPRMIGMAQGLGPFTFLPDLRKQRERLFLTLEVEESVPPDCDLYTNMFRFGTANIAVAALRAECERLQGDPTFALETFARPALALKLGGAEASAVRARAMVDLGDFAGAEALLSGLDPRHRQVAASRWYLAFVRNDPDVDVLREALEQHPFAPDPALLIPELP